MASIFTLFWTSFASAHFTSGAVVFKNLPTDTKASSDRKKPTRVPARKKQLTPKDKLLHKQALNYAKKSKQNKPATRPMEDIAFNYTKIPFKDRPSFKPKANVSQKKLQLMAYSNCFEKQAHLLIKMKSVYITSYQTGGSSSDSFFDVFYKVDVHPKLDANVVRIGKKCEREWIRK
jgi:hypothetical protein